MNLKDSGINVSGIIYFLTIVFLKLIKKDCVEPCDTNTETTERHLQNG